MRKLAWFAIFVLVAITIMSVVALVVPGASTAIGDFGYGIFGGIAGIVVTTTVGAMAWGAANFTQAIFMIVIIYVVGAVSWLVIKKYMWDKLPLVGKKTQATSTKQFQTTMSTQVPYTQTAQSAPATQSVPASTPKVEETTE